MISAGLAILLTFLGRGGLMISSSLAALGHSPVQKLCAGLLTVSLLSGIFLFISGHFFVYLTNATRCEPTLYYTAAWTIAVVWLYGIARVLAYFTWRFLERYKLNA